MLPTDKSKPSTANVTVTPMPSNATTATDCRTLNKLLNRKNACSNDWKKKISPARTRKMAYLRRKWPSENVGNASDTRLPRGSALDERVRGRAVVSGTMDAGGPCRAVVPGPGDGGASESLSPSAFLTL